jgi:hypothetical protein
MHKKCARTGAYEPLTTLCASCILALRLANTAVVSGPARSSEIAMSDESATLNSCRGFALTAGSPDSNNCRVRGQCGRGSSRGPLGLREPGIAVCCPYTTIDGPRGLGVVEALHQSPHREPAITRIGGCLVLTNPDRATGYAQRLGSTQPRWTKGPGFGRT